MEPVAFHPAFLSNGCRLAQRRRGRGWGQRGERVLQRVAESEEVVVVRALSLRDEAAHRREAVMVAQQLFEDDGAPGRRFAHLVDLRGLVIAEPQSGDWNAPHSLHARFSRVAPAGRRVGPADARWRSLLRVALVIVVWRSRTIISHNGLAPVSAYIPSLH